MIKFLLLALVNNNLYIISIFILLLNMISIFFYMKLIRIMFFDYIKKYNSRIVLNYSNALIYSFILFFLIFFLLIGNTILLYVYKLTVLYFFM